MNNEKLFFLKIFRIGALIVLVDIFFEMLKADVLFSEALVGRAYVYIFIALCCAFMSYRAHALIRKKNDTYEELNQSKQRYRMLFTKMLDAFALHEVICDDQGRPDDYRFLEANPAFEVMTGLTLDTIIGKCVSEVIPNLERSWIELYGGVVRTGEPVRFEQFSQAMNRHFEVIAYSPAEGQFATIFKDISERKKTEEALIEAKSIAEEACEAKTRFLANVSHEIRTPINAVVGFADFLRHTPLSGEQKDYVSTIRESGQILVSLINDILDLSKIEADHIELESIVFNLEYLIESVFTVIRPKVKGAAIDLVYYVTGDIPHNYKGDPTRLRQVLINLLSNAVKFTRAGEIVLTVGFEEEGEKTLAEGDSEVRLKFSVRDTGIGIPQDKQNAIFESFVQADSSTTRLYGGTGLGLSIVRALVERMGGDISVVSEPGKGSEFTFTVKLESVKPLSEDDIVPLKARELGGKKVFIVDDNKQASFVLHTYCTEERMQVVGNAHSVARALEWLNEHTAVMPDVMLVDIMMPGVDGFEFVKTVRKDARFTNVKMVAITSDIIPGTVRYYQEMGFHGYLPKPVVKAELMRLIQTVLGDRRAIGQIITRHMAEEVFLNGLSILVVEDNQINMKLIQLLLERFGCTIDIAHNGEEGVKKLRGRTYDLVFMDIQMPVMDGCTATEIIRREISQTVPIIAITAGDDSSDKQRAIDSGMNDFISKPIEPQQLKVNLHKWARR